METIEYSLVILASLLFAGYGVYLFTNYASYLSRTGSAAAFSSVLSAAWSSIQSSSERRLVVFLSNASLACRNGSLSLDSGSTRLAATIGAGCNFAFSGLSGIRTLVLRPVSGNLSMTVEP